MKENEGLAVLALFGVVAYAVISQQKKQTGNGPGAGGPGAGGGTDTTASQVPGATTPLTSVPNYPAIDANCYPPDFVGPIPDGAHYCSVGEAIGGFFTSLWNTVKNAASSITTGSGQ